MSVHREINDTSISSDQHLVHQHEGAMLSALHALSH